MNENIVKILKKGNVSELLNNTRVELEEKIKEEYFLSIIHVAEKIEGFLTKNNILDYYDLTISSNPEDSYSQDWILGVELYIKDEDSYRYEDTAKIKAKIENIFFEEVGKPPLVNFTIEKGDDIFEIIIKNLLNKKDYIFYKNSELENELKTENKKNKPKNKI